MSRDDLHLSATSDGDERALARAIHPLGIRWSMELRTRPIVLGRLDKDDVPALRHGTVSRRHLEVRWDDRRRCHLARDLGSHNGSRLDGEPIGTAEVELHDGAVLQLGDVTVVIERLPPGTSAPSLAPRAAVLDAALDQPTRPRAASATASGWGAHEPALHPGLPGRAPVMEALRHAVWQAATERAPVWIWGERGTGKDRVAVELHRRSHREGPLVAIDCSRLDPNADAEGLLRSAEGGTLVLEGLDALPPARRAELLPALRKATLDVRLVITSLDVPSRADGMRSLAGRVLRVPPLRERRGDVPLWIDRLHAQWLEERPDAVVDTLVLSVEAIEQVLLYPWPSNLHELRRLVEELASARDLPRPIVRERLPGWLLPHGASPPTLPVLGPPQWGDELGDLDRGG